jgi:hypothetical protein
VTPDAILRTGRLVTLRHVTPLIGTGVVTGDPESCRGGFGVSDPTARVEALGCVVYRVRLDLDQRPDALNVVFIRADFKQIPIPSPDLLELAAPSVSPLNGIDFHVFAATDREVPSGGESYGEPTLGSFEAKQPEYDIVVDADPGINAGFTLSLRLSNEVFPLPFEALDPTDLLPSLTTPSLSADLAAEAGVPAIDEETQLLPVNTDSDLARVGLGVSEQFDASALSAIGAATRNVSSTARPPSAIALIAALFVGPALAIGGVGLALYRRRHALI